MRWKNNKRDEANPLWLHNILIFSIFYYFFFIYIHEKTKNDKTEEFSSLQYNKEVIQ